VGGESNISPAKREGESNIYPTWGWGKKVIEAELMRVGGYGKMKNFRMGGGAKRALALP
jgi:hypothetical protein